MSAHLNPRQIDGLITDTTNRVLGDELLLQDGKYQRPDTNAPDYPENLPADMAEDLATHARASVEAHLAEAYNDQFGSLNSRGFRNDY